MKKPTLLNPQNDFFRDQLNLLSNFENKLDQPPQKEYFLQDQKDLLSNNLSVNEMTMEVEPTKV